MSEHPEGCGCVRCARYPDIFTLDQDSISPVSNRTVAWVRNHPGTARIQLMKLEAENVRLREAADALLAAYDRSGLTDLRWFVPYVEALRDA